MSRKTITISKNAYDRLAPLKDEDESWTDIIHGLVDEVEGRDDGEHSPNTVAVTNVDEIARATATEVENRMARR
jgi:predicted CopG family antitoxin